MQRVNVPIVCPYCPGFLAIAAAVASRSMRDLDLSRRDLSLLKARLAILRSRTDPMIPFTEYMSLEQAARSLDDLYIPDSLSHVELKVSGLWDFHRLWTVAYVILGERDGMPPPRCVTSSAPGRHASDAGERSHERE